MTNPTISVAFPVEEIADRIIEKMNGDLIQPRLLTAEQAGKYIGRPVQMVRKMYRDGLIQKCSHDGRLLFDRVELDRVIEEWKGFSQGEVVEFRKEGVT